MSDRLPDLATVAERLAYARARLGMTREELASALAARGAPFPSVMTIRRSEAGTRSPTADELLALAGLSGLPAAWLLTGEGVAPEAWGQRSGASAGRRTRESDGDTRPRDDRGSEESRILAHLEAELMRTSDDDGPPDPQGALRRVETRVRRLRERGELSEEGWAWWCATHEGALLVCRFGLPGVRVFRTEHS